MSMEILNGPMDVAVAAAVALREANGNKGIATIKPVGKGFVVTIR